MYCVAEAGIYQLSEAGAWGGLTLTSCLSLGAGLAPGGQREFSSSKNCSFGRKEATWGKPGLVTAAINLGIPKGLAKWDTHALKLSSQNEGRTGQSGEGHG